MFCCSIIFFHSITTPNLLLLCYCQKLQMPIFIDWVSFFAVVASLLPLYRLCEYLDGFSTDLLCVLLLDYFFFAQSLLLICCCCVTAKNCRCRFLSVGRVFCCCCFTFAFAWVVWISWRVQHWFVMCFVACLIFFCPNTTPNLLLLCFCENCTCRVLSVGRVLWCCWVVFAFG